MKPPKYITFEDRSKYILPEESLYSIENARVFVLVI